MTKLETTKLLNQIKGYYNSQFFIDDYVLDAWSKTMKSYDYEDAVNHIQQFVKNYPDTAPKPQTFTKGLNTIEEKEAFKHSEHIVSCQLCGRWMPLEKYDEHYGKCLDIEYLLTVAKTKGDSFTRKDLENCKPEVINKLLAKYPPKRYV